MFHDKILLIGASGRGKTYSFRNMDRETTGFINVENKPFPFKGEFKHTVIPANFMQVLDALKAGSVNPNIKCIVVDSFSAYVDMLMLEARATKTGWERMNFYNEYIGIFNDYVKKVQKPVFVTAHYELLSDEQGIGKEKRVKVKGKEWEGVVEKDYTIVIYADAKITPGQKKPEYFFTLVNDGMNSAKTPPDIFGPDTVTLDNDSKIVLDKIIEFRK